MKAIYEDILKTTPSPDAEDLAVDLIGEAVQAFNFSLPTPDIEGDDYPSEHPY